MTFNPSFTKFDLYCWEINDQSSFIIIFRFVSAIDGNLSVFEVKLQVLNDFQFRFYDFYFKLL
jgi:hypothetical protein